MTEVKYSTLWRNKHLNDAEGIAQMIKVFEETAQEFREMMKAGVELEQLGEDNYLLSTYDPDVAQRFGFEVDDDEDLDDDEVGEGEEEFEDILEGDNYDPIIYGGES